MLAQNPLGMSSTAKPPLKPAQLANWSVIQSTIRLELLGSNGYQTINAAAFMKSLQLLRRHNRLAALKNSLNSVLEECCCFILTSQHGSSVLRKVFNYYKTKRESINMLSAVLLAYFPEQNDITDCGDSDGTQIIEKALLKQLLEPTCFSVLKSDFLSQIQAFRLNDNLIPQTAELLRFVKEIGLFKHLEKDYILSSKDFYIECAEWLPRREEMIMQIYRLLSREQVLEELLGGQQSTVYFVKKELIQCFFPAMLQFTELLMLDGQFERLSVIWQYAKRLGIDSMGQLHARVKDIVSDCKIMVVNGNLKQVLDTYNRMQHVITKCFESNRQIQQLVSLQLQKCMKEHEKIFQTALINLILSAELGSNLQTVFLLFRLYPNKEALMRELQVKFAAWFLTHQQICLEPHAQLVSQLQKECGMLLCKNIDKLISDVWRNGNPVTFSDPTGVLRCRMVSSEWKLERQQPLIYPQSLQSVINGYLASYKELDRNCQKNIRWLGQYGVITVEIDSIECELSELELCIVLLLSRSYRPIKAEQFAQMLNVPSLRVIRPLKDLEEAGIIVRQAHNNSYELSEQPISTAYHYQPEQVRPVNVVSLPTPIDHIVAIEAAVVRILKRNKTMLRCDLSKAVVDARKGAKLLPQQLAQALRRLVNKDFVQIDRNKGIVRYLE